MEVGMKRIFACLFITAVLPLMASPTQNSPAHSAPFATVAYAGHTLTGSWCQCGCAECVCDPGEQDTPCIYSARTVPDDSGDSFSQDPSPSRADEGFDFGSSVLMFALGFFLWTRF